ncbi:MAG: TIGR02266 family protein [Deltaproteobacteria bacterium]|nr:TIGR02266 family protein [Deltaproteobacteria bacterium]MBW1871442.1 TIGR02266 family protein [Deltaproteobacteria bacterium]
MSEESTDEKRAHIRAPIELKVEYKKMNTFFADYTKNISKGGTFIKTDRPLPVGTEFLFRLVIPSLADPFEIKGTVIWTNSEERKDHPEIDEFGMGIQFVYENDGDRDDFEQMVEGMMRESLGDLLFTKLLKKE